MQPIQTLFASVRAHGPALLASTAEPAAELLALVWGPRFDREHAQHLAQLATHNNHSALHHALAQAADMFDSLPAPRQQRLRQLLRHQAGVTIRA